MCIFNHIWLGGMTWNDYPLFSIGRVSLFFSWGATNAACLLRYIITLVTITAMSKLMPKLKLTARAMIKMLELRALSGGFVPIVVASKLSTSPNPFEANSLLMAPDDCTYLILAIISVAYWLFTYGEWLFFVALAIVLVWGASRYMITLVDPYIMPTILSREVSAICNSAHIRSISTVPRLLL